MLSRRVSVGLIVQALEQAWMLRPLLLSTYVAAVHCTARNENPNCVSRGHCTTVGPGTRYPEQVRKTPHPCARCVTPAATGLYWHCRWPWPSAAATVSGGTCALLLVHVLVALILSSLGGSNLISRPCTHRLTSSPDPCAVVAAEYHVFEGRPSKASSCAVVALHKHGWKVGCDGSHIRTWPHL